MLPIFSIEINKFRCLVVTALLLFSCLSWAYDFKSDRLCYKITSTIEKTVSVTYEKSSDQYVASYNDLKGNLVVPSQVYYNGIYWNVVQIDNYAFRGCRELTSVTLNEGIQTIGAMAFESCTSLKEVFFPSSLTLINYSAFSNCCCMERIECLATIPPFCLGTTVFDIQVSDNNKGFCQVLVPGGSVFDYQHANGWKNLPIGAFDDNQNNSLNFKITDKYAGEVMVTKSTGAEYSGDIIIPSEVSISGIKYKIVGIDDNAFANCTKLTSIVVPDEVRYIGDKAFLNCVGITSIKIPVSVTYIGSSSFKGCTNLRTLDYFCRKGWSSGAGGETAVWENPPFADCTNLTDINIGTSVREIPDDIFKYVPLKNIVIPDYVEILNSDCFADCINAETITIGKNVKEMTNTCFGFDPQNISYSKLETIYFNATNLNRYHGNQNKWYPFFNAPASKLVIGEDVKRLPDNTFNECVTLREIIVLASVPPTCGLNCFENVSKSQCVLKVPRQSLKLYRQSYIWKNFYRIEAIETGSDFDKWYIDVKQLTNTSDETIDVMTHGLDDIVAFQCDIKLPTGMKPVMDNGEIIVDLGDLCTSKHIISANYLADGTIRVVCYSLINKCIFPGEGKLFTLHLNCTDLGLGQNQIEINNIHMSQSDSQDLCVCPIFGDFEVTQRQLIIGDTNGDGRVSVSDAVNLINHILEKPVESFIFEVADINNDNQINVSDAVGIIKIVLGKGSIARARSLALSDENYLSIPNFEIEPGEEKEISIYLNNTNKFTAFQFDMSLPAGLDIELEDDEYCFYLTNRSTRSHMIGSSLQANGDIRVVSFSTSNSVFKDTSGALITFTVRATKAIPVGSAIGLKNIIFTEPSANDITFEDSITKINESSSESLIVIESEDSIDNPTEYFNINGIKVDKPVKGLYIVKRGNKYSKEYLH